MKKIAALNDKEGNYGQNSIISIKELETSAMYCIEENFWILSKHKFLLNTQFDVKQPIIDSHYF